MSGNPCKPSFDDQSHNIFMVNILTVFVINVLLHLIRLCVWKQQCIEDTFYTYDYLHLYCNHVPHFYFSFQLRFFCGKRLLP